MMQPIQLIVTAAIIEKDKKFLITQRPKGKHNPLRWEFPGGKLEFGEDPRQCLKREIKEELNIDIDPQDLFEYSSHVYDSNRHILLLAFRCKYLKGKIEKKDIADYAWASPDEMNNYDITEADTPFVEKLAGQAVIN